MNTFAKPNPGDYPSYFDTYLSKVPEGGFSDLISKQLEDLKSLFASKPSEWADLPYAEGKWSPKEVLGHVLDTERIFTFRALCFARGEQQSLPGFDQDPYVLNARFGKVETSLLLADFEAQRRALLSFVATLDDKALDRIGNANGKSISPRTLFWIIPGHFEHHFSILKERY